MKTNTRRARESWSPVNFEVRKPTAHSARKKEVMESANTSVKRSGIVRDDPAQVAARMAGLMTKVREQGSAIDAARSAGEPALRRLVSLCEERDSGQVKRVAGLLAGLYNGRAYPFDLADLRALDLDILDDCMSVLRMDANALKEAHAYFVDGEQRFKAIFRKFGVTPLKRAD